MLGVNSGSMNRVCRLFLPLCLWCCVAGCDPTPPEYQKFLALPPAEQIELMEQLPTDKQIDYFLAGERYAHPPLRLGNYIAKRGRDAVPFLVERLKKEDSPARKVNILHVLEDMNKYHYNLKDEKEALKTIGEVVASIKDPLHKPRAEQAFDSIVGQQEFSPTKP